MTTKKSLDDLSDSELLQYYDMFSSVMAKSKRAERIKKHGFDTKSAYHVARLADEADQILNQHDIDLQRSKEYMKAIRRGEVSEEDLRKWFSEKELSLEKSYRESTLPYSPDENKIKQLLLECLEHHYGSLDKLGYIAPDAALDAVRRISLIVEKVLSQSQ